MEILFQKKIVEDSSGNLLERYGWYFAGSSKGSNVPLYKIVI
jgi:hypothetical protein